VATTQQHEKNLTAIQEPPLVQGGLGFKEITEKISGIIESKFTLKWVLLFGMASSVAGILMGAIGYLFWEGIGIWGLNQPNGWGFDITNFVFLGWYRSCRNFDFGDSFSLPPKMAHLDQPICRSDDAFRGDVRRRISWHSRWSSLGGLLDVPNPESDADVAKFP
jgi:hypothetical protein